jgi:hypothetical protein
MLSKSHKRGISTTLQILDEALCEMEQWANGRQVESVLYRERNDLTGRQRAALLREIAGMRDVLRQLRDELDIEPAVQSARSAIRGRCSMLWEHIVELKAKHLRRYGEVPAEAAEHLDARADLLIEGLLRVLDTL